MLHRTRIGGLLFCGLFLIVERGYAQPDADEFIIPIVGLYIGGGLSAHADLNYGVGGGFIYSGIAAEGGDSSYGIFGRFDAKAGFRGAFVPELGLEFSGGLESFDSSKEAFPYYSLGGLFGISWQFDATLRTTTWLGLSALASYVETDLLFAIDSDEMRWRVGVGAPIFPAGETTLDVNSTGL